MGSGQGANKERVVAYRLKFSSRAARELGEAYEWYEAQSQGLGLLPRFPYGVFYVVRNDLVHILAVIHNARNPTRWPGKNSG